jgi:hypothetical protein
MKLFGRSISPVWKDKKPLMHKVGHGRSKVRYNDLSNEAEITVCNVIRHK